MMLASMFLPLLLVAEILAKSTFDWNCVIHIEQNLITSEEKVYVVNTFYYTSMHYGCYLYGSFPKNVCHEKHKLQFKNDSETLQESYNGEIIHCCDFDGLEHFFKVYPVNCTTSENFKYFSKTYFNSSYEAMLDEMALYWMYFINTTYRTGTSRKQREKPGISSFDYLLQHRFAVVGFRRFPALHLNVERNDKADIRFSMLREFGPDWDVQIQYRRNYAQFAFNLNSLSNINETYLHITCSNTTLIGRKIWEDILASGGGRMAERWLEAVRLERQFGDLQTARKMLYKIRSRLAMAFNVWLEIDDNKLKSIMKIVEMLHNASLLIDDIEDNSLLRRGLPVTHSIFGTPRTINSANYIYFIALQKCVELGHPGAITVFTEQMLELHRGQGKELFWRDTVQCPDESQYETMVVQKTGGLFFLAVRLMELFSEKKFEFGLLLTQMALYFQIRDDYLNLVSDEMSAQKSFAEDLTEGKFSFPLIHAVQFGPSAHNDDPVLNILRQRTQEVEVKKYCIKLIKERGSLVEYTVQRLHDLKDEMNVEVRRLGGNQPLEEVLEMLSKAIE